MYGGFIRYFILWARCQLYGPDVCNGQGSPEIPTATKTSGSLICNLQWILWKLKLNGNAVMPNVLLMTSFQPCQLEKDGKTNEEYLDFCSLSPKNLSHLSFCETWGRLVDNGQVFHYPVKLRRQGGAKFVKRWQRGGDKSMGACLTPVHCV